MVFKLRAALPPIPNTCRAPITAWRAQATSAPWEFPIANGREFTHRDTLDSPGVIVINEAMAREFWPKENPVGKAIRLGGSSGPRLTVVGVAGDVHYQGLDTKVSSQFMRPYTQAGWPIMNIVVRTSLHTRRQLSPHLSRTRSKRSYPTAPSPISTRWRTLCGVRPAPAAFPCCFSPPFR